MAPKMAPRWPKMAPRWPQDGPRWPKDGPKMAQDGPKMPQDTPRWSKMAPRWPQDGPKRLQDGLKMAQVGPKMAPRGAKMGSGWAPKSLNSFGKIHIFAVGGHLGPKMAQDSAKLPPRGPKMAQDGPKRASLGARLESNREKLGMFHRPWPLGRPARAVLFFFKNTHRASQDLTRPGPKARRILGIS